MTVNELLQRLVDQVREGRGQAKIGWYNQDWQEAWVLVDDLELDTEGDIVLKGRLG